MFLFESTNQNQISITGLFEPFVFELKTRTEILVTKITLGSGDWSMYHDWEIPEVLQHLAVEATCPGRIPSSCLEFLLVSYISATQAAMRGSFRVVKFQCSCAPLHAMNYWRCFIQSCMQVSK